MSSIALLDILRFTDAGNVRCGMSISAAGKLIVWRGTNATILATSTTTLIASAYYYIEIQHDIEPNRRGV